MRKTISNYRTVPCYAVYSSICTTYSTEKISSFRDQNTRLLL